MNSVKTVLVTGGCGFIGAHFVRHLLTQTDYRIVNLDLLTYAGDLGRLRGIDTGDRYRFVRGDLADRDLLKTLFQEELPHAVVNFAAESHVDRSILDPWPFIQTNIAGVQALLEATRQFGTDRLLHISTDEVYGDTEGLPPAIEESPLRPSSPYAASKAAADLVCLAYRRTYDARVLLLRCSNNFGPFQFPEKLIPFMIRAALNGEDLPIYGDGGQRRDWLFVDDACVAVRAVLEKGALGLAYNASTGSLRSNLDVVQAVCELLAQEGGLSPIELRERIRFVQDRPGHDRRYEVDASRIRRDLGWSPRVSFEDGLLQTVRWYLANQAWLKQVTSGDYRAYVEAVYSRGWGLRSRPT
jgi:dTDP-glucose 4,6-dehydratase